MILFKGKKKGLIHTMDIRLDDIRAIFFPKDFYEKYKYLGAVPWNSEGKLSKVIQPLVIFMDYKSKPNLCPRWFLRFLYLFGCDNSLVRIRNYRLSQLFSKLTKGYKIWDYKTKWTDYDLRISISGDQHCQTLASGIESKFYRDGLKQVTFERILEIDPNTKFTIGRSLDSLQEELNRLEEHEVI
jgi:hypothetical protein